MPSKSVSSSESVSEGRAKKRPKRGWRAVGVTATWTARRSLLVLDGLLSRLYRLRVFSADPDCILRISERPARLAAAVALGEELTLPSGALVIRVHFANDRLPKLGQGGPDLVWARRFDSSLRRSLELLAAALTEDVRYADFAAVHGVLGFLPADQVALRQRLAARFGFVIRLRAVPGRAWWRSSFWSALYSRWLAWAFNPVSLRSKPQRAAALTDLWMTRETLLERYGPARSDRGRPH